MLATDSTIYGTINKDTIIEMSEENMGLKPLTEKYFNETCIKVKAFAKIIAQQQADILTEKTAIEGRKAFFFARYRLPIILTAGFLSVYAGAFLLISSVIIESEKDDNIFSAGIGCLGGGLGTVVSSLLTFKPQILKDHSKLDRQLEEMNQQWSRRTKFTDIMDQLADFRNMLDQFRENPDPYKTKYLFDFLDDLINEVHEYTSIVSKDIYKIILMDQLIQVLPDHAKEWNATISSSHINNLENFVLWKRLGIEIHQQEVATCTLKTILNLKKSLHS